MINNLCKTSDLCVNTLNVMWEKKNVNLDFCSLTMKFRESDNQYFPGGKLKFLLVFNAVFQLGNVRVSPMLMSW